MPDTPFVQERLSNGLTVVVEIMPDVQSAACGFLARTGSRDERAELAGVSHFLEHMCFKGTARRSSEQLNLEFDEIGADNNAQTGKDQTFYYSWARTEDLPRQLDLLADMMHSTLPADEFEVERKVILEEIATYKDDLASNAYDFLYENVCAGSPLAWPVVGYERTIREMTPERMGAYLARRYRPGNLILVVAGNVEPDEVMETARRLCGSWENVEDMGPPRRRPRLRTGVAVHQWERFHRQAVVLALPSAPATHPQDESAEALTAILGGANSRFYWNIVQKGLATQASVTREEYRDFGLLIMYGLCEPENCEKLLEAMRREASEITDNGPEPKEIQRVKNRRRTLLATESEAPGYRLGQLADDTDYRGAPRPAEARLAEVDAVSSETVADYLREYPITGDGFLASVGPRRWPVMELGLTE